MCHLLLMMPFASLALFLVLPFRLALPIYAPIALVSVGLYYLVYKAMRMPQQTGIPGMVGGIAEVVRAMEPGGLAQYLVRYNGELWSATSRQALTTGEQVRIVDVREIRLLVERPLAEIAGSLGPAKKREST